MKLMFNKQYIFIMSKLHENVCKHGLYETLLLCHRQSTEHLKRPQERGMLRRVFLKPNLSVMPQLRVSDTIAPLRADEYIHCLNDSVDEQC